MPADNRGSSGGWIIIIHKIEIICCLLLILLILNCASQSNAKTSSTNPIEASISELSSLFTDRQAYVSFLMSPDNQYDPEVQTAGISIASEIARHSTEWQQNDGVIQLPPLTNITGADNNNVSALLIPTTPSPRILPTSTNPPSFPSNSKTKKKPAKKKPPPASSKKPKSPSTKKPAKKNPTTKEPAKKKPTTKEPAKKKPPPPMCTSSYIYKATKINGKNVAQFQNIPSAAACCSKCNDLGKCQAWQFNTIQKICTLKAAGFKNGGPKEGFISGTRNPKPQPKPAPLPPPPPPPPPATYTNTGSIPTPTSVVPLPGYELPLPPNVVPPPPSPTATGSADGCPTSRSIKNFGAKGDGSSNDAGAFNSAMSSNSPYIYLPTGVYRIKTSMTITKPIVAGSNTYIHVNRGLTVTFKAQLKRPPIQGQEFFRGAGDVKFDTIGLEVYPDWFKLPNRSDADALQAAANSCSATCTLLLTRQYQLDKSVSLNPTNGVFSTAAGNWNGPNAGTGIVLRPGVYKVPMVLGVFTNYATTAIKVPAGVTGANLQIGFITRCENGILVEGLAGQTTGGVTVSHLGVTQDAQNTVLISTESGVTVKDLVVRVNFAVTGGIRDPTRASAGLAFQGIAPAVMSNVAIIFQAVDPAQFRPGPEYRNPYAALQNRASGAVNNLLFRVDTWLGGFEPPGKFIDGHFSNSEIYLSLAGGSSSKWFFTNVGSSTNTRINTGTIGSAGLAYTMATAANRPGAFGVGSALQGSPTAQHVQYYKAPVTSNWPFKEERTFYLLSVFGPWAKGSLNNLSCVPFRAYNPGIICSSVVAAPTATSPYQVAVKLRNMSGGAVLKSNIATVYFAVQVGP